MAESQHVQLDAYHWHEALDRTDLIMNMIEDFLVNHPVLQQNEKLLKKAKKAQSKLNDLYQEIGAKNF